ncbi:MAG: hypothetical protein IJ514_06495, partial [Clostridia bacterium]|nr:hypothetical protein [Clostridia bacterium]
VKNEKISNFFEKISKSPLKDLLFLAFYIKMEWLKMKTKGTYAQYNDVSVSVFAVKNEKGKNSTWRK